MKIWKMKYLQPGGLFSTWGRLVVPFWRTTDQVSDGGKIGGSDLPVDHFKCGSRCWDEQDLPLPLILIREGLAINWITTRMTRPGWTRWMLSAPTASRGARLRHLVPPAEPEESGTAMACVGSGPTASKLLHFGIVPVMESCKEDIDSSFFIYFFLQKKRQLNQCQLH